MKKTIPIILCLLCLGSLAGRLESTIYCTIAGKVIDEETGQGIKGVDVYLGSEEATITDANGNFLFTNVYPASYCLHYEVPFPYVAQLTHRDKLEYDHKDCINLVKGEYRKIIKKIGKGGGVKGKIKLEGFDKIDQISTGAVIELYKVEPDAEKYKDPGMKTAGIYQIDATYRIAQNGNYEIVGLPEGRIIIVVQGETNPSVERRYFPGKLKIMDIIKDQWTENIDFFLEENKPENANLKIEIFSSFNNQLCENITIATEKIENIWNRTYYIGTASLVRMGEGAGNVSLILESGKYLVSITATKKDYNFKKERLVRRENWDSTEFEVEIVSGKILSRKVFLNIKGN